ncbi:MAG: hypothetical protein DHS20C15_01780 [Planctomycetota bacterium]|nr:MAG: hypothetical protein DHS20C15_01780 [Planctomycetota bacterium]
MWWIVLIAALLPFAQVRDFDHVWDDHVFRGPGSSALSPDVSWTQLLGADLFAQPHSSDEASGLWRPLVLASYRIEAQLAGASQAGFLWLGHVGTLLLHALASLAFFALMLRLGLKRGAALLGATLFALHPVHAEPVSWLSGRMDVGATAAGLLGLLALLSASRHSAAGAPSGVRPQLVDVGAAALFVAALLCKETGVVFLPLAVLLAHSAGLSWRRSLFAPVLAGVTYAALRAGLYSGAWLPEAAAAEPSAWWTTLAAIPAQLRLMLWPGEPTPVHPLAEHHGLDRSVVGGIIALLLLGALTLRAWRQREQLGVLGFGVLTLGLLALLPWLSPGPRADLAGPLNERYLYALSLAPCLGFAWLAARCSLAQPVASSVAALALVIVLAPVTARRSEVWRDDAAFVEAGLRRLPEHPDLWVQRGDAALQAYARDENPAHLQRALVSFENALVHEPQHRVAAVNRFIAMVGLGRDEEELVFYAESLLERWPDDPLVLFNVAAWHAEAGHPVDARRLLSKDLSAAPWHPKSRALLNELR